jgi:hypothetical protein
MMQVEATAGRDVVPTLVLCCAKDTRHLLPPALELLVARGFQVEVVSGLELRDDAVIVTAQRKKDAAYVLFESAELVPALIERTKAKLVAAGVKPQRIATMPLDWRGPLDVVAKAEHLVVAPPTVRRPTSANLGAAVAAIPPPVPRPKETPAVGLPAVPHQPLLSGSVPVLDGGDDADAFGFVHARRRLIVAVGALAGALALLLGIVAIASDDEDETASTQAVAIASPGASPFSAAWSWLRRTHGAQAEIVDAPAVAPAPTIASVADPQPVSPPPVAALPITPLPTPAVAPAPVASAPTIAAPEPKPVAAAAVPEEIVAVEEVADIDEAEMQAIYAGLIGQKFRALDILLIAPEPRKRLKKRLSKNPAHMTFGQAAAYCDKLEVSGVAGWRLPRVGELGSITGGSLIADGKFWSQTEGDTFGKSRIVWNTQTSKMGSAPVRWKGGRVVCVRTMARPPELPASTR